MASARTTSRTPAAAANGLRSDWERYRAYESDPLLQRLRPPGIPLLFEDEGFEMGETTFHTISTGILLYGLAFHFARQAGYRVFSNLNLYYSRADANAYVTPDVMVVKARRSLPAQLSSYRISRQTPGPIFVGEVLSFRTWQQGDLSDKPILYSDLGVEEYILADVTGEMLEQRLLLLRRRSDGKWRDEQDPDGGITSRLGFRVVIEEDGHLRVIDTKTGKRYGRPEETQAALDELSTVKERLARLEGSEPRIQRTKRGRRKS
jgi:Uma2 family endonuclease